MKCVMGFFAALLLLAACTDDNSASGAKQHYVFATEKPLTNAQRRAAFLRSVNEAISGGAIASNPFKYVGKNVDLHCTVADIPDEHFINAACGEDADGGDAIIVIETNAATLSKGQAIRVIGTVDSPMEGTNAMGGTMKFPTVRAHFVQ